MQHMLSATRLSGDRTAPSFILTMLQASQVKMRVLAHGKVACQRDVHRDAYSFHAELSKLTCSFNGMTVHA